MGMCFDKRVVIGLGVVALGVLAVSPRLLGSLAPLLLVAACPLSMVFMMRAMNRDGASCDAEQQKPDADGALAAGSGATERLGAAGAAAGDHAQLRELEEEVNRLKAELHLRDQERSR